MYSYFITCFKFVYVIAELIWRVNYRSEFRHSGPRDSVSDISELGVGSQLSYKGWRLNMKSRSLVPKRTLTCFVIWNASPPNSPMWQVWCINGRH